MDKKVLTDVYIPPWSCQIEMTSGCNLRCEFCYINALPWPRDYYRFMSPDDAFHIGTELITLNDHMRIECAMRGEPLMNPDIVECIAALREAAPKCQLQLTSNGLVLLKDEDAAYVMLHNLYEVGLNILLLDCYAPYGDKLQAMVQEFDIEHVEHHQYGVDKFSPWNNRGPGSDNRHIVYMPDIKGGKSQTTRKITNMGGNSSWGKKLDEPLTSMCPIPWREISIFSNGDVPICCNDAGAEYLLGNILEQSAIEIWQGDVAQSARKLLRYGQRLFSPCARCDGPTPGRNRAIPHCVKADEDDFDIVYDNMQDSPKYNGKDPIWLGSE